MFAEISRVLRPNGKAIIFGQEPFTSKLITSTIASIPLSYRAIWLKDSFGNKFMCNKAMVNLFEDICIFSKVGYDFAHENPAREYLLKELVESGLKNCKDVNRFLGTASNGGGMASHYFAKGFQFAIPTKEKYEKLQETGRFELSWDELNEIYQSHKNKTPSVFNLWQGGKSKSNVLEYKKDNDGYHPTQKPVALLEDLIQTYSNVGNTVLDFTMGSGSTGVACVHTGRNFIGIELDEGYFQIAKQRIENCK